jgi:hypothetical protein
VDARAHRRVAATVPGAAGRACFTSAGTSPPPGCRSRAEGSIPTSTSPMRLDHGVARHTRCLSHRRLPARSSATDFGPATTGRCTSFRWGSTVVKNRASSSRLASTNPDYAARIDFRWTLNAVGPSLDQEHGYGSGVP